MGLPIYYSAVFFAAIFHDQILLVVPKLTNGGAGEGAREQIDLCIYLAKWWARELVDGWEYMARG